MTCRGSAGSAPRSWRRTVRKYCGWSAPPRSLRGRATGLRRGLESCQARRSRGRVVDPHKEAVTTPGAIPSPGPKGWACKETHALLRSRIKPSRLDPRPRLACAPLQTQRRPVSLPRRLPGPLLQKPDIAGFPHLGLDAVLGFELLEKLGDRNLGGEDIGLALDGGEVAGAQLVQPC